MTLCRRLGTPASGSRMRSTRKISWTGLSGGLVSNVGGMIYSCGEDVTRSGCANCELIPEWVVSPRTPGVALRTRGTQVHHSPLTTSQPFPPDDVIGHLSVQVRVRWRLQ